MTFLQKYELLKKSIPVPAVLHDPFTQNCEYGDYLYQCHNCLYCFDSFKLEDSIYCSVAWGKNLVDCQDTILSELCYECIRCRDCYGSTYLLDCERCQNCHFSSLCVSCSDCFGCVGLKYKKYCIFNKQYSKEEYFKEVERLKKEDPQVLWEQMLVLKKQVPHPASTQVDSDNCPYGESISASKESYWCFNADNMEKCGYIFNGGNMEYCWDQLFSGGKDNGMQRCYEMTYCNGSYDCAFCDQVRDSRNCYYSSYLANCTDCFGCVGLTNKKYCILNNQLTKEQYEQAVREIKEELGWKMQ